MFFWKQYFYTLFAALVHQLYGLPFLDAPRKSEYSSEHISEHMPCLLDRLAQFENHFERCIIDKASWYDMYVEFTEFEKLHRTRTTNKTERFERVKFLSNYIAGDL